MAPDARVVLSVRDDQAEDVTRPFKDTVIDLAEVRRGDYVVVERRGPEGKELAQLGGGDLAPDPVAAGDRGATTRMVVGGRVFCCRFWAVLT